MEEFRTLDDGRMQKLVFSRFITIRGIRRYHPTGGVYRFWVDID